MHGTTAEPANTEVWGTPGLRQNTSRNVKIFAHVFSQKTIATLEHVVTDKVALTGIINNMVSPYLVSVSAEAKTESQSIVAELVKLKTEIQRNQRLV